MTARLVLLALALPGAIAAQSVRISGTTTTRYVEMRPFMRDSIAVDSTSGDALLRQLPDGRIVRCVPGETYCRDVRAGAVVSGIPVTHDLDANVWGIGRGVRLYAQARAHDTWSGDRNLWPAESRPVELLSGYAEVDRDQMRVRLGRQWKVSGLGVYNFDGLSALYRPVESASIELYGGRSLIRGLNDARATGPLEALGPQERSRAGALVGVQGRAQPTRHLAFSALYQVDLRSDRRGVYSELAAADGVLRGARGSAESSVELDLASRQLNEARLRLRSAPLGAFVLNGEVRRYRPYFELWTIWGAFSPIGFDEERLGATFAPRGGRYLLRAEATYRKYAQVAPDESLDKFRDNGWGLNLAAGWSPDPRWRVDGSFRYDDSFGAAGRDGQLSFRRELGTRGSVAIQGLAFQRLYEFRLGDGTVVGAGAEASWRFTDRLRLFASAAGYHHTGSQPESALDWNQRRATLQLSWTIGAEPGLGRPARGIP